MRAAAEKITQEGGTTSHGPMVSANFNGVTVAFAHSESDYTAFSSHHIPSLITAPKVIVEVGENLSIKGAYIKGEKVEINVAKDILIESLKDVNTMASSSSSISLGVSFGRHGIAPAVSFAVGEGSENSELVNFISGIGGGDISVVTEKIHLKGSELYGMEKLKVIGEVSKEDIEEINESSSAYFGISFDPTKATAGGNPLTSVNFGISEKHDNGVVHSGLGQQASHESTSKGGYTVSGEWNNVLQGNAEKAVDWFKNPEPNAEAPKIANDWKNPDEVASNVKEETTEPKKKLEEPIFSSEKIERELVKKYGVKEVEQAKANAIERLVKMAEMGSYKEGNNEITIELPKEVKLAESVAGIDMNGYKIILKVITGPEARTLGSTVLKFGKHFVKINPTVAIALTMYEIGKMSYDRGGIAKDAVTFTKELMKEALNKGTILSTPEHRNEGSILDTPEHKQKSTDQGFTPWDGAGFKDQGFTPVPKELLKNNPGFAEGNLDLPDMTILMNEISRHGAFNEAKQDAGIPRNQQPVEVRSTEMTDRNGRVIKGQDGIPIVSKEYIFTRPDGIKIAIQDHSAGHQFGEGGVGDQGAHFNVRGFEEDGVTIDRNSKISGTKPHYPFNK